MKTTCSNQRNHALTLLEAVVVMFCLFIMVAMLLPALGAAASKRSKIGCMKQLKEMGLGFRVWEGDNHDKYPMSVSATNGGAMELAARGNAEAIFQAMSNTLSNPKILVCPADKSRWPVPNFSFPLTSKNISYFINVNASEANPQDFLCGDDNFEVHGVRVKSGLLEISATNPVVWSHDRHGFSVNVALADGSVQGVNNLGLKDWLRSTNFPAMRLAIP
jgi:prepilin-type processing-associated H-X9-DG protein